MQTKIIRLKQISPGEVLVVIDFVEKEVTVFTKTYSILVEKEFHDVHREIKDDMQKIMIAQKKIDRMTKNMHPKRYEDVDLGNGNGNGGGGDK